MSEVQENVQQEYQSLPRLNEPAPQFTANTTKGPLSLSDFKGKWVVLFSHPADFTPVCTTEFIAFAKKYEEFKKRDVEVVGLSIDSIYSHIAWIRNIEEKFGVKIPFPVIADLDMKVARLYGMVHPQASDTSAVRAVFVIDPGQILRAMVYYPLTNGRSIDEILRLVEALQTSDEYGVATPENWHPGDPVIVPPPATQQEAEERVKQPYEVVDWYFSRKKLEE